MYKKNFDSISIVRVNEMMYVLLLFCVLEVKSNTITDFLYIYVYYKQIGGHENVYIGLV